MTLIKPKASKGDAINAKGAISGVTSVPWLKHVNRSSWQFSQFIPKNGGNLFVQDSPMPSTRALILQGEIKVTANTKSVGFVGICGRNQGYFPHQLQPHTGYPGVKWQIQRFRHQKQHGPNRQRRNLLHRQILE